MSLTTLAARWTAAALDWAVISLVVNYTGPTLEQFGQPSVVEVALGTAWDVLIGMAYFTAFEGLGGASPGKFYLRFRVTAPSGGRPGITKAAIRAAVAWGVPTAGSDLLASLLPAPYGVVGMLGSLLLFAGVLFVPARRANGFQAWHDRWSDTRVAMDARPVALWRVRVGRFAGWLGLAGAAATFLVGLVTRGAATNIMLGFSAGAAGVALALALIALRPYPLLVTALTMVVTLFAAPLFMPPPQQARGEASAIGSLRAVNSAQAAYSSSCAGGGYATDLADLFNPPRGSSFGFISPDLDRNGVVKSGYIITVTRDAAPDVAGSPEATCNDSKNQPVTSYFASANPQEPEAGRRYFATDTRGTIFYSLTGPVSNPIPPDTPVVQ